MILLNNTDGTASSEWRDIKKPGLYKLSSRISGTCTVKFEFRHGATEAGATIKDTSGDVAHTTNDMTQVALSAGQIRCVPSGAAAATVRVRVEKLSD